MTSSNPPGEKKYRVACIKDFPDAEPDDVRYVYVNTLAEAKELMQSLTRKSAYQSEQGGHISGLPHVATLEQWDEEGQEWVFADTK